MNPAFWRGRKVFLTGHTGFKGSWLSLWLQNVGADVTGYALTPPNGPNLFEVGKVAEGMTSIIGDIRDLPRLVAAVNAAGPDVVIHMAAQPLVRYSYANPVETYSTNVMGTVHVLEAVRATPSVCAVVVVTSDKCYQNNEWVWGYRESERMGGHDPYSNSKGCAELVTAAYRDSFFSPARYSDHGVAVASARAGNVIGGGDWAEDRLIPDLVRAIRNKQPVRIRNPHAIRPWQHVLEPLSGYLLLAEKLIDDGAHYGEGWNFGPADEDAKPVQWIAERMTQLWGDGASWVMDDRVHPHEASYLKLDCSKAKARLGWRARWNLHESLEKICGWHKAYEQADMRRVSSEQINQYMKG
ncbi:CDP-glucose 4,6-dehydratase [Paraburkholderia sp. GAS348]|uniref:CDP-glucose 4,6-dehydratase n=1 Tax=Paraburkholderia sp. GAS348 TaxID=3035132 RepID=UPI003D25EB41